MNIIKEKNNFIDFEKRKANWKSEIKIRGLSFQEPSKANKISFMEKEFVDLRKKIISHKRVKSAYITGEAVKLVKHDLKQSNQREN